MESAKRLPVVDVVVVHSLSGMPGPSFKGKGSAAKVHSVRGRLCRRGLGCGGVDVIASDAGHVGGMSYIVLRMLLSRLKVSAMVGPSLKG